MRIEWRKVTWYSKWLALILFVGLPFLGFYLGVEYGELRASVRFNWYRQSVQSAPSPSTAQIETEERAVIAQLAGSWKSIAPRIIPNYPPPQTAFYGYPYGIQFIGNHKILIGYETDFNPWLAVLAYNEDGTFTFIDQQMIDSSRASKWQEWIKQYGSPEATLDFYKFSSTREGEVVYPSDWVKVSSGKNDFE